MLIADIKTYDSSNIAIRNLETTSSQVYQIEQYCTLIQGHNYDIADTVKAIIHLDRKNVPESFVEFLWTVVSLEIDEQQYQKEHNEIDEDTEDEDYFDPEQFWDVVIPDKKVKITYWK